jgi:hypothetical protein
MKRADGRPFVDEERHPCIEANVGIACDERVVGEPRIEVRVLDDERVPVVDAVPAEGEIARGPRLRDPHAGLEPLVVGVDERDERDLGPAELGCQSRHVVKRLLGLRVDDVAGLQESQPPLFVVGNRGLLHRPRGYLGNRSGACI